MSILLTLLGLSVLAGGLFSIADDEFDDEFGDEFGDELQTDNLLDAAEESISGLVEVQQDIEEGLDPPQGVETPITETRYDSDHTNLELAEHLSTPVEIFDDLTENPNVETPIDDNEIGFFEDSFPLFGETSNEPEETQLVFSEEALDQSGRAMDHWAENDSVQLIHARETDEFFFQMPTSKQGSLIVMNANCLENHSSHLVEEYWSYSGLNVYFVPEGEEFPPEYEWSENGATLHNTLNQTPSEEDFGHIRLIARIDTGLWAFGSAIEEENSHITFDRRVSEPEVRSNVPIVYFGPVTL